LTSDDKEKLKKFRAENDGTGKAILLDDSLVEIKNISIKSLNSTLRKISEKPSVIIIDGTVTASIITASEDIGVQIIVAKNFATTDTKIKLLSL